MAQIQVSVGPITYWSLYADRVEGKTNNCHSHSSYVYIYVVCPFVFHIGCIHIRWHIFRSPCFHSPNSNNLFPNEQARSTGCYLSSKLTGPPVFQTRCSEWKWNERGCTSRTGPPSWRCLWSSSAPKTNSSQHSQSWKKPSEGLGGRLHWLVLRTN